MNLKIIVFFGLALLAGLSSCEVEEMPATYNVYNIDNQSSYKLIYNQPNRKISLDTVMITEIFSKERIDQVSVSPDDALEEYADSDGKVYLYREDNGTEIPALNLYLNTDLTWTEEYHEAVDGNHIFHHTLIVTDNMIQ